MDFSQLKKQRTDLQSKLREQMEKLNTKESYKDDRFWKLDAGKDHNGAAVIRFLMPAKGDDIFFERYFSHSFKGPGGWLIENCLTTLGQKCPVCEANSELWNTEIKANQDLVRTRKRKLNYVSNIFVVSDPKHPENNGKVFLFRYGQKIYEKLNDLMCPDPETGDEAIYPYDFWEGANFKLRMVQAAGYPNYDKSLFDRQTPLAGGDDEEIEKIWKSEHSLAEFKDPKSFLSYDELKKKLEKVLGAAKGKGGNVAATAEDLPASEAPVRRERPAKAAPVADEDTPPFGNDSDDDDPSLDYFAKLASEA